MIVVTSTVFDVLELEREDKESVWDKGGSALAFWMRKRSRDIVASNFLTMGQSNLNGSVEFGLGALEALEEGCQEGR